MAAWGGRHLMKKWFFIIDVGKCEHCNNCFLSCKDEHVDNDWPGYTLSQPRHGQRWMNIRRRERGQYPLIDVAYRPTPCMHCANAPCMAQAANGAVRKREDGIVLIDPEKAVGQKNLVQACPYGAIWWNEEKKVPQKCTFCAHLLDQGWEKTRCAQVCPTGALGVAQLTEAEMTARAAAENLRVLHPEYGTQPRVYYRNLHRFDRSFLGGSVAIAPAGVMECAGGARVTLWQDSRQVAETVTDAFGDFKFDGLQAEDGPFRVEIELAGFEKARLEVDLQTSRSLPEVVLTRSAPSASESP
jgi:Fe-S-cluster-containing dehydrogenase component